MIGARVSTAYAWEYDDGSGAPSADPESLNRRRVTECALSRICGTCGDSLGRPVAFVGTADEVARNSFHAPPLHLACATRLAGLVADWEVVSTSGFEYVRPNRGDVETRPTFVPNSLIS